MKTMKRNNMSAINGALNNQIAQSMSVGQVTVMEEVKKILAGQDYPMEMKDILYIGVRVDPKDVERVLLGTPYENYPAKGEAHMTIAYKPNIKRLSELLPLLGREVELSIQGVGDLVEDGVVKNVGLKVAAPEGFMPENVPHITVWTNDEAGARAVNTHKCTWKIPLRGTIRGKIAAFNAQNDWAFTIQK